MVLLALSLSSLIILSDFAALGIFFAILVVTFLICGLSALVKTPSGLGWYTAGVLLMWIGHGVSLALLPGIDDQQSDYSNLVFVNQLILLIASVIFLAPMLIKSCHRVRKGRLIALWERSDKKQRGNKLSPSNGTPQVRITSRKWLAHRLTLSQNETPPNAVDGASELDNFESSSGRQHRDDPLCGSRGANLSVLDNATLKSVAGLGEGSLASPLPAYQRPPPAYPSPGSVTCSRQPAATRWYGPLLAPTHLGWKQQRQI